MVGVDILPDALSEESGVGRLCSKDTGGSSPSSLKYWLRGRFIPLPVADELLASPISLLAPVSSSFNFLALLLIPGVLRDTFIRFSSLSRK